MTRVLHVFPDSVLDPTQTHLGSTKDIRGRTQYFAERGMTVDECVHERSARGMKRAIAALEAQPYDIIVVEFPLSGRAISQLRNRWPTALLLTRSENAELLHRRDWIRAMGPSVAAGKLAIRAVLNTVAEIWAARCSDALLSISEWEAEHYWPRLTSRGKIEWLPYYIPDQYLEGLESGDTTKQRDCVCLTSTRRNPLIEDSVRGFERAIAQSPEAVGWRFLVTGDVSAGSRDPRIVNTGMLNSPGELLRKSRAVALLSDLGYGFKTKVLEAIVAGNRVLVTPGLYQRIPDLLYAWTFEVDLKEPHGFALALAQAEQPLPDGDPNGLLRAHHHAVLDRLIGRHADSGGRADADRRRP
jgi:hypothetical protein